MANLVASFGQSSLIDRKHTRKSSYASHSCIAGVDPGREQCLPMSIHSEIKRLRLLKGWSHRQLAEAVSAAEHLNPGLSWQTVQQWEREPKEGAAAKSTAPKRKRLEIVAHVLGTTPEALMSGHAPSQSTTAARDADEGMLLAYYRMLDPEARKGVLHMVQETASPYGIALRKEQNAA